MKKIVLLFAMLLILPWRSSADPFVTLYHLRKYSNIIKEVKDGYEVTLTNHKKLILKNANVETPEVEQIAINTNAVMHYNFSMYMEDVEYLLFRLSYYEDNEGLLININNGKQYKIPDDIPHVSPDKKRLVVAHSDEASTAIGIKIFRILPEGLNLEWSGKPNTYDYQFHSWGSNEIVKLNGQNIIPKEQRSGQIIYFTPEGWKVKNAEESTFPLLPIQKTTQDNEIEKLRSNEETALYFVKKCSCNFQYVSENLKDNEQFVKKALSTTNIDNLKKYDILRYISEHLRNGALKEIYSTYYH